MRQAILFQLLRNNKPISVHNTITEANQALDKKYQREMENLLECCEPTDEPIDIYEIKPVKLNN